MIGLVVTWLVFAAERGRLASAFNAYLPLLILGGILYGLRMGQPWDPPASPG